MLVITTSTSELVASTLDFEVSDVSASYTACLDPWPLLLLLPVLTVVDRHSLEKWPCLLHLKQNANVAGHSPTWCKVPHAVHSAFGLSGRTAGDC